MLTELVKKYRDPEAYDLSCSETMIYAANEYYSLNLDSNTFRAMAPFAGGMLVEGVCGALTGAYAVLGIIYTNNVSHDSEEMRIICEEYHEEFIKHFDTSSCKTLKTTHKTEEDGCDLIILKAFEILDETIKKHGRP